MTCSVCLRLVTVLLTHTQVVHRRKVEWTECRECWAEAEKRCGKETTR